MKRLSQITESIWSDIQDRSGGETLRQEDGKVVLTLDIDGVTYKFTNVFMSMGDDWNEENSDEWIAFAFNRPNNKSNLITGNTDNIGSFGIDYSDFEDEDYDVYVLKDYLTKSTNDMIDKMIETGNFGEMYNAEIQDVLLKYTKKIFEDNHMSEYAYYYIISLINSDWGSNLGVIWLYDGTDICKDELADEFEGREIESCNTISYADIEGWTDEFEKELIETYERLGWTKAETDPIDPFGGAPSSTRGIIFVQFAE